MSNLPPVAVKDSRFICRACGDLLFVFAKDVEFDEPFVAEHITGGQDFQMGERADCRKCGTNFMTYGLKGRMIDPLGNVEDIE